jgi:hypothetical protein
MTKIHNFYLSNDSKNVILVYNNYTNIFNIETQKEARIIDEKLENITFSNNNYFSGIHNEFYLFSYNLEERKESGEMFMNLPKDNKILKIKYCIDNYLIIFTSKGHIYHYKNDHITLFKNISQIKTSSPIISIDFSKDFDYLGVLCHGYFFILINNNQIVHLNDIYLKNNDISKIKFCPFDNKIFYLITNKSLLIFKINYEMKLIIKLGEILINVKEIEFNIFEPKIIIISNDEISYIYKLNILDKYILVKKIRNSNLKFYNKYKVFYFNKKLIINDFKFNLIKIELNSIDKNRTRIKNNLVQNYKTMIELMNNQVIQYDHAIECKEIDYIKKIHLFLFLTKIPYFFNFHKEHNTESLKFPIKKKLKPDFIAIDQFIKFIYTDVYPDALVIFNNLDFFKEITDKLWYGKENYLKVWVDKIDLINKQYLL